MFNESMFVEMEIVIDKVKIRIFHHKSKQIEIVWAQIEPFLENGDFPYRFDENKNPNIDYKY